MVRYLRWLFLTTAVMVVGWPIAGVFWFWRHAMPPPVRLTSLSEVTRVLPLNFPAGAALLDGKYQGGMSRYLGARIRLPRGEVSRFLAQTPFNSQVSKTDRGSFEGALSGQTDRGAELWRKDSHPESARHFVGAAGTMPKQAPGGVQALIVLDDPAAAILYLYYED